MKKKNTWEALDEALGPKTRMAPDGGEHDGLPLNRQSTDMAVGFGASKKGNAFMRQKPGTQVAAPRPILSQDRGIDDDFDWDVSDIDPAQPNPDQQMKVRKPPPTPLKAMRNVPPRQTGTPAPGVPKVGNRQAPFKQDDEDTSGHPYREASSGGVPGFQKPMDELRALVRQAMQEIVRKKEGGGGFTLYAPNKGKKKSSKPAGEFPTRVAAKRAELARFPPKDPEQLKRARKRIDKLSKDPKKRAEAERKDLTGGKPVKKSRKPAADRKKAKRESLIRGMVGDLSERLFRDEEIPGSAWDEKLSNLSPDAISSDKRLAAMHKKMHQSSTWALDDAHKGFAKFMRGMARIQPGEISMDDNRKKMFVPVMMDVDGEQVGPIHFYIDGGHVRCEVSQACREQLANMDPDVARDLRGNMMTYTEDHLPEIDHARTAWSDRDSYLDKLHQKLDKHVGGMSSVEVHLAKQLLNKQRRR